jgi:RNA polymerase sigma-70 factor (ECF subfamily)
VQEHSDGLADDLSRPPDERFDLSEAIESSMQTLPEVQRAILQLRDVEGYSYREIGETLQLSDDRVQVYLFRARVAMRKQLIKLGYGND